MKPSNLKAIPVAMRIADRWLGRRGKVPFRTDRPGALASSTDPATWGSFERALAALRDPRFRLDGIGFALGDGWAALDSDGCRDPLTGEIDARTWSLIERLNSYTEVSPSGTGIHIFCHVDPSWRFGGKRGGIEVYTHARYFTVTGERIEAGR